MVRPRLSPLKIHLPALLPLSFFFSDLRVRVSFLLDILVYTYIYILIILLLLLLPLSLLNSYSLAQSLQIHEGVIKHRASQEQGHKATLDVRTLPKPSPPWKGPKEIKDVEAAAWIGAPQSLLN